MDDKELNITNLEKSEADFLKNFALPSCSSTCSDILCWKCCPEACTYSITRREILLARHMFMKSTELMTKPQKRQARTAFLRTLLRINDEELAVISVTSQPICLALTARIFGSTVSELVGSVNDPDNLVPEDRPYYGRTVAAVAYALSRLRNMGQADPTGGILLPPSYCNRSIRSSAYKRTSLKLVRKVTKLKIKRRNYDSLTRCNYCSNLKRRVKRTLGRSKSEAKAFLQSHHQNIALERSVVKALENMSRDEHEDIILLKSDAMSNKSSKLPHMDDRPKHISDSVRVICSYSACQIATPKDALSEKPENHRALEKMLSDQVENVGACTHDKCNYEYENHGYLNLQGQQSSDSCYSLSIILDALTKISAMSSQLVINLDSCPSNKCDRFFGGMAVLLSKLENMKVITLVYGTVGHTHSSIDAHFGVVSRAMMQTESLDPYEFAENIRDVPSVSTLCSHPTIYDFEGLEDSMRKWKYRSSQHQISFRKNSSGEIYWSAAKYITAGVLFEGANNEKSFPVFLPDFDVKRYSPKVRLPNLDGMAAIQRLFKESRATLTEHNRENYIQFLKNYGKQTFRCTISKLNRKPRKVASLPSISNSPEAISEYLEKHGYKSSRLPKNPIQVS